MPVQTLPIALGRGVNRGVGLAAANPRYPVDARNVYAKDGRMVLRPGLSGTPYPDIPWGTDVIAIQPVKATLDELFVVFDRVTRQIRLFRLDPANAVMQPLAGGGVWGTINSAAPFPIVVAAEADGIVFFAHAENDFNFRLATVYYTPDTATPTNPGTLTVLEADLDGDGDTAPVKFRGVYAYREYMTGWGYGNESSPDESDAGDTLRLSMPVDPLTWLPENYLLFGVRKQPIITCIQTGEVLAVGKQTESYKMVGSGFDDFDPLPLDGQYGAVSARGAINIGGIAMWYSSDGPRRVTEQGTMPAAQELDIGSPLPDDFPALGPQREVFVNYDTMKKLLEFYSPNLELGSAPTPGFALSLWDEQDPRWSLFQNEQALTCAGIIYTEDTASSSPPSGYPMAIVAVDDDLAPDANYRVVKLDWVNVDADGDELVQLFAKPLGGAWSVVAIFPVGAGAEEAFWETALPVTAYELAMRFVRGSTPTPGYEGDPDSWTAPTADDSKTTVETTSEAVTWGTPTFNSDNDTETLPWLSAQLNGSYFLEKSLDGGGTWLPVAVDFIGNTYIYPVPDDELGATVKFRVTAQRGAVVGPTAGVVTVDFAHVIGTVTLHADYVPGIVPPGWSVYGDGAGNATNVSLFMSPDGVLPYVRRFVLSRFAAPPAAHNFILNWIRVGPTTTNYFVKACGSNAAGGGGYDDGPFSAPVQLLVV